MNTLHTHPGPHSRARSPCPGERAVRSFGQQRMMRHVMCCAMYPFRVYRFFCLLDVSLLLSARHSLFTNTHTHTHTHTHRSATGGDTRGGTVIAHRLRYRAPRGRPLADIRLREPEACSVATHRHRLACARHEHQWPLRQQRIQTHTHTHTHTHTCVCACAHACVHACMRVCIFLRLGTRANVVGASSVPSV